MNTPMQDTIWTADGNTKIATIADLPWNNGKSDWMTEQANAALIALAPTLLAQRNELRNVLRAIVRSLDNKEGFIDANTDRVRMAAFEFDLQQARSALAIAKD